MSLPAHTVRFGPFKLDLRAAELDHNGSKIKLPEQPFQILCELVSHPGEVVTREELRQRLWGSDTFVDFEQGLNTAVKRLREVLGDSAEKPQYIETLPRHGYRLMVPVEKPEPVAPTISKTSERRRKIWLAVSALLIVAIAAGVVWRQRRLEHLRPMKIESLAVLPLENLSGSPEEEYFADGMTQALITELGKIQALRVISWQSVKQFKGTNKPVPQIARELHVDAVVEGSALRAGDRVRITTQLVQANPERNLWSESYERDLRDVIALQRGISLAIVREIKVSLNPQEQQHLTATRPVNREAYEAYLKGWFYWNKRAEPDISRGIEYFQHAIEIDPGYALAYVGLADSYMLLPDFGDAPPREAYPQAKAALAKAIEIDETLGEAHAPLAYISAVYDHDWAGAEREFKRAIELNPGYATAHHWYAYFLLFLGRNDEATAEVERARDLDPLSLAINTGVGTVLLYTRHYDSAIAQYRKTLEMDPRFVMARDYLGNAYLQNGMYEQAIAEFQKAAELSGGQVRCVAGLGRAYAAAGKQDKAREVVEQLKKGSQWRYVPRYELALIYTGLGEKDQAFASLEQAYQERDRRLAELKVGPQVDSLRSDPRFQDLLRRMNFPP